MGLAEEEFAALAPAERERRTAAAHAALRETGADYVVDSIADLLPVVDAIEARLARGERPPAHG